MKPWIKELLQTSNQGFISINKGRSNFPPVFPVLYTYHHGKIRIPSSILFPDRIKTIIAQKLIILTILSSNESVELRCKIQKIDSNLDQNWVDSQSLIGDNITPFNEILFLNQQELLKHVILELTPITLIARKKEEKTIIYEMEIL